MEEGQWRVCACAGAPGVECDPVPIPARDPGAMLEKPTVAVPGLYGYTTTAARVGDDVRRGEATPRGMASSDSHSALPCPERRHVFTMELMIQFAVPSAGLKFVGFNDEVES